MLHVLLIPILWTFAKLHTFPYEQGIAIILTPCHLWLRQRIIFFQFSVADCVEVLVHVSILYMWEQVLWRNLEENLKAMVTTGNVATFNCFNCFNHPIERIILYNLWTGFFLHLQNKASSLRKVEGPQRKPLHKSIGWCNAHHTCVLW